ncbi:hypothetical protein [Crocosphaera sp. XPORK-15E]|uniref:hypothetical protein n=1 Tax=Crocosphaera sp. XPORK-15E TaxID=3110247 RepID=UPI002B1FB646|nr:hypothetical protein [Crocosphaera sp. XPORK-15E]MEA5533785.1 hypothetical protein [Crocosphaera sp. XPORK-15E]
MFNLSQITSSSLSQKIMILGVISAVSIPTPSLGAVANFDNLDKGFFGRSITDNGITFSNLIAGFRIGQPEFIVKSGNQFNSVFSQPNYLTFGSSTITNGNSNKVSNKPALGNFGSMNITPENLSNSVSLDVLTIGSNSEFDLGSFNDSLVLEAFLEGDSVGSISVPLSEFSELNPSGQYLFANLSLSNIIFDNLQLYTPVAFADGVISLGVDNVSITPLDNIVLSAVQPAATVPESQPITLLGLFLSSMVGYVVKTKQGNTEF